MTDDTHPKDLRPGPTCLAPRDGEDYGMDEEEWMDLRLNEINTNLFMGDYCIHAWFGRHTYEHGPMVDYTGGSGTIGEPKHNRIWFELHAGVSFDSISLLSYDREDDGKTIRTTYDEMLFWTDARLRHYFIGQRKYGYSISQVLAKSNDCPMLCEGKLDNKLHLKITQFGNHAYQYVDVYCDNDECGYVLEDVYKTKRYD